jgi:hypothetical protein
MDACAISCAISRTIHAAEGAPALAALRRA